MIVYVNNKGEIKDVNSTSDTSLIETVISDTDNPFSGWSVARICCYRVDVENGVVQMMTPYLDTRVLSHVSQLGDLHDDNVDDINATMSGLTETYETSATNTSDITACLQAITELYEMMSTTEE